MSTDILGFSVCALLVIFSGIRLSHHGDRIAELTGLGKAWIGLVMMASVTSLPELISGISAVAIVNAPDLAAGDIFGSCVFNLLILSIIDARLNKPVTSLVKTGHIVAGFFGITLLALSALAIVLAQHTPVFGWVSAASIVIALVYFAAVYGMFKYEQSQTRESEATHTENKAAELKRSLFIYGVNALVVIAAALFLPHFGERIASNYGLSTSFFGTLFLAATTSLPELVVSFASLRLGSFDMVVGNLLGSNIFNIFILALDDAFYRAGALYANISPSHLISALAVIIMTAVVGLGIMVKSQRKVWRFGIDTLAILLIYAALMGYLYVTG
jgi:cation:H+ antiporter